MCNLQSARIAEIGEKRFEEVIAISGLSHYTAQNVGNYKALPKDIKCKAYVLSPKNTKY